MSIAEKLQTIAENEQKVYDAGVEKGSKEEYNTFWDNYQSYGKIANYAYLFAHENWNDKNFFPKYDIAIGNYCFYNSDITDLKQKLIDLNISYDVVNLHQAFRHCKLSIIPDLSKYTARNSSSLSYTFAYTNNLHTIEGISVCDTAEFNNTFDYATSLQNIKIYGTIGTDFDIHWSPLTLESAKSIINCLKDYSNTNKANTYTVSFSATTWGYLDEDGNNSPAGTTWREYISSLGWNY